MSRSLKLKVLWILLEKLDLCKRRLVTSNILVTSGTTQKRGNVTSQVFLSSLGELCQVLAQIQVCVQGRLCISLNSTCCTKGARTLREREIYQPGSRELTKKNYNGVPARTSPGVFSRRPNWKQTQSRTENLSATGENPLLRASRDNRDKEEEA